MEITWTPERIRALGPTTDLPTLASILRCSKWKAYQMARTDQWAAAGIRIIRVGSSYKVVVLSILEVLGYVEAGKPPAQPGGLSPVRGFAKPVDNPGRLSTASSLGRLAGHVLAEHDR